MCSVAKAPASDHLLYDFLCNSVRLSLCVVTVVAITIEFSTVMARHADIAGAFATVGDTAR